MPEKKENFYITTSIAYVNGTPHLGFAMESIEADVLARWARREGRTTYFLTGTDEHGIKIIKTAEEKGLTPKELCDKNSEEFKKLGNALNISNDDFIRTSDQKKHWKGAQKIWKQIEENGDLEKRSYTAKYCSGCEAFLTEKDLDNEGKCPHHKRSPEEISEENYFFLLSRYSEKIAHLIESEEIKIIPDFRKNEILNMAKSGFLDVSFSRPKEKAPWGIPVPGDNSQTMYVWCDALTNYISALGYGTNNDELFQSFWKNGETVHVIGKDILRFHAGIWIGMLLSADLPLPKKIFVHGFLTNEGEKMSKSTGNIVDPFEEIEKYGVCALRYFLLREIPIGRDADFSRKRFEEVYQSHLANGLGNLCSRIHKLCEKNEVSHFESFLEKEFKEKIESTYWNTEKKMEKFMLHESIAEVFSLVEFCDKKMDEIKPWIIVKNDPQRAKEILKDFMGTVLAIADLIEPFLPIIAKEIAQMFGSNKGKLGKCTMLFPRLEILKEEKPNLF